MAFWVQNDVDWIVCGGEGEAFVQKLVNNWRPARPEDKSRFAEAWDSQLVTARAWGQDD